MTAMGQIQAKEGSDGTTAAASGWPLIRKVKFSLLQEHLLPTPVISELSLTSAFFSRVTLDLTGIWGLRLTNTQMIH